MLGLPHQLDWSAEHGLDGIFRQRLCNRADVFDVGSILFHPALDNAIQSLAILAHDCADALTIEGEDHVVAIILHVPAKLDGRLLGQQILVE